MVKIIIFSFFLAVIGNFGIQKEIKLKSVPSNSYETNDRNFKTSLINFSSVLQDFETPKKSVSVYNILEKLFSQLLLIIITIIVVITPLVLIYCWLYYSVGYVKKFKNNIDFKNMLNNKDQKYDKKLPRVIWFRYRKTYSKMIGFGISIIAYAISSNLYIYKNFEEIGTGLKEYFSFPFLVFKNVRMTELKVKSGIPLTDVWLQMIFIVCISILLFFVGYFMGQIIVNLKYKRIEKFANPGKDVLETIKIVK